MIASTDNGLAQAVADMREDARILDRTGHRDQARYLEDKAEFIQKNFGDFMSWLSMKDARLKSGLSERTLNRRFNDLLDCKLARLSGKGEREFLACAIPQRADQEAARARGRRGTDE